ncbi:high-affinity zinc transporter, periplasmic component [Haemophilus pittmaniae HK 85]|uniref:High-affinity zinc uptake system protein ZnuA n=1 Tax=Haemophilus pittmaniae HK 85 TaxID=1035188 RepID=F9QBB7_9PAST|nr:zinc ABC transporter substrate-binding protein ZnuA [Haemophilus pittmaniae]EGV05123.1 high-affinity zinc transporter, periplasmic component [Haemophilus pittmaniae HK 85]MBS6026382.1 zinc ABC transporter substrate-binding protein ZnuA [Haemophilus pittmaniae]SNV89289.1 zinc ABC transporter periplasmic-binding protein [Haemophilus pittmaniae]
MKKVFKIGLIAGALLSCSAISQADVLTSVKPLGFIASSIAQGVENTQVLVPPGASPHDYSLKLSDMQKIKSADLIVWVGEDIDAFLAKPIQSVDPAKVINIAKIPGVQPLLLKAHHEHFHEEGEEGHQHGHNHSHEHEHGHHHHDVDENGLSVNWHLWYSPQISRLIAEQIAEKLTVAYPDKKELIAKNLADFNQSLSTQSDKITAQLAPLKEKGFFVFHDAYGYFNQAYGLNQTGYFTINPLVAPGAKTLAHIKEEITEHHVNCLFAEPQFTPKVIESLAKETGAKVGRLDPIGDKVELGAGSYAAFLQATADSYAQCLGQ